MGEIYALSNGIKYKCSQFRDALKKGKSKRGASRARASWREESKELAGMKQRSKRTGRCMGKKIASDARARKEPAGYSVGATTSNQLGARGARSDEEWLRQGHGKRQWRSELTKGRRGSGWDRARAKGGRAKQR